MEARGERVHLRPWREGDEPALVRHGNNRKIWRNLTNRFPHPYAEKDARLWVETANAMPEDARHFAIVFEGAPVGGVGFERLTDLHSRSAEIGYWLGESVWGRGLATESLRLATKLALGHFDFARLQAGVLGWNPASRRVLEKGGYRLEGRLERHVFKDSELTDLWLYALTRPER